MPSLSFRSFGQTCGEDTASREGAAPINSDLWGVVTDGMPARRGQASVLPLLPRIGTHSQDTRRVKENLGGAVLIHTPLGPMPWSHIWVRSLNSLGKVGPMRFVTNGSENTSSYTQHGRLGFRRETSILTPTATAAIAG